MSAVADERRPLPTWAVVIELARLALVRTMRGRALWVAAVIAALPALLALVIARVAHELDERIWESTFLICRLALVVVPAVLVGAAVADEVEDKTSAYLWSRAIPRWTVIVGKLLVLAPLCGLVLAGGALLAYVGAGMSTVVPSARLVDGLIALVAAGIAASAIAAMIATLVPRHAVAVTIGWMFAVDLWLAEIDIPLRHLSTGFGARAIAGFIGNAGDASGAITLLVLTVVATAVACWRVGKLE